MNINRFFPWLNLVKSIRIKTVKSQNCFSCIPGESYPRNCADNSWQKQQSQVLIFCEARFAFIVFYEVIGTLSHAKIILELLLQNDKAKAFSEGEDLPSTPLLLSPTGD